MGGLEHLVVKAYTDDKFKAPAGEFAVWINPASYTHDYGITYTDRQGPGSNGASPGFNKVGQETVAFELVLDATGVVPPPKPGMSYGSGGVAPMIEAFVKLAATVNSTTHRPNVLKLIWAELQFECVLAKLAITYTLFQPDGTPLRAKLAVSFHSYASEKSLQEKAKLNSPDMSHLVTVVAGDTLPALCHRIYGSSRYYLGVAAFNNLTQVRQLRPGTELQFPPLSGSAQ